MPVTISRFVDEIDENHLVRDASRVRRSVHRAAHSAGAGVALGDEDIDWGGGDEVDDAGAFFRVGARVRHDSFGLGEVLQVEAARGGQKLTVKFRGGRVRKLMTPYARLTAVSPR
jgi:hypothetical protein